MGPSAFRTWLHIVHIDVPLAFMRLHTGQYHLYRSQLSKCSAITSSSLHAFLSSLTNPTSPPPMVSLTTSPKSANPLGRYEAPR